MLWCLFGFPTRKFEEYLLNEINMIDAVLINTTLLSPSSIQTAIVTCFRLVFKLASESERILHDYREVIVSNSADNKLVTCPTSVVSFF
jgi:hypothetical protein